MNCLLCISWIFRDVKHITSRSYNFFTTVCVNIRQKFISSFLTVSLVSDIHQVLEQETHRSFSTTTSDLYILSRTHDVHTRSPAVTSLLWSPSCIKMKSPSSMLGFCFCNKRWMTVKVAHRKRELCSTGHSKRFSVGSLTIRVIVLSYSRDENVMLLSY